MTSTEKQITAVMKSRGFTWLLIAVSLAMGWIAYSVGISGRYVSPGTMWLPDPGRWIPGGGLSAVSGVVLAGACGVVMAIINKVYNLLRTVSLLFVGLYMIMLTATPEVFTALGSGPVLALVILLAIMLLYSIFDDPHNSRRLFLVFVLLTAGAVTDYSFIPFIPVFIIGARQLKCLSWRSFAAALIGVATPVWIMWGFGLLDFSSLKLPDPQAMYKLFDVSDNIRLIISVGITLLLGLVVGVVNLMKIIAFNARSRSMTGFLSLLGIVTGVLCIVDFTNIMAYVVLLDVCVAFQIGLFMRIYESRRAYILGVAVILIYSGCFVCNVIV